MILIWNLFILCQDFFFSIFMLVLQRLDCSLFLMALKNIKKEAET